MHGREHRAFNDRLDELGYPTKRFERITKKGLAIRERLLSPKSNLAATAALEHFTATLAELVLSDEETRDLFGHDEVRNLFLWHALEESEHKAVAFDVYKAVGGTERMRVWTMKFLRFGFVLGMAVQVLISLLGDRATYKPGVLRRSWRNVPPLARSSAASCGTSSATTTGPTSTPTTATRPRWSSAGGPSCSASRAR